MLKITLVTMGHKMPSWVEDGVSEYSKRLQEHVTFNLIEIPLLKRGKSQALIPILDKEAETMRAAIPSQARLIALDSRGASFTSEQLAENIALLQHKTSHLCFIIGGPEGLSKTLLTEAREHWSLSKLTLPHTLVRITLMEALYRAFAILNHHPYHK